MRPMIPLRPQASGSPLTTQQRSNDAEARLFACLERNIAPKNPRSQWVGGENYGATPLDTTIMVFPNEVKRDGMNVIDFFDGITCSGARTVL